jgi:hypothetical protein
MTDWGSLGVAILMAAGIPFAIGFGLWGVQPWLRRRKVRKIRRTEKVRLTGDVNTELYGYRVRPNRLSVLLSSLLMVFGLLIVDRWQDGLFVLSVWLFFMLRRYYVTQAFQSIQTFVWTERGMWLFPERNGLVIWKERKAKFCAWQDVKGYKIDGTYLQLFRGEEMLMQVEFAPDQFEEVKAALAEMQVRRLEPADRIWVAQFDELEFYRLEDEALERACGLLDLYQDEFLSIGLLTEFGVMRNMPGDRLLDEHARSWLQLNLICEETGDREGSSAFPLWQSNGNVGFLIGARGQEMALCLQEWLRTVLSEARRKREGVVS